MTRLVLTDSLLAIWSALIEERTGIQYREKDRTLLECKLEARALDGGFDSLLDYYYFLRYDASSQHELEALVDALVVNETYFFREADQLRALCDAFISPMIARGESPRIWSAACSTGEEPLTLAMMLAARGELAHVKIVATDIAPRVIEKAKSNRFGKRSVRALPSGFERWIDATEQGATVSQALLEAIEWGSLNLVDARAVQALGAFDVILCRNVLIYFSDDTVRTVVRTLANGLRDSGALLVGVSESLLRFGTLLQCEERAGAFFYLKKNG